MLPSKTTLAILCVTRNSLSTSNIKSSIKNRKHEQKRSLNIKVFKKPLNPISSKHHNNKINAFSGSNECVLCLSFYLQLHGHLLHAKKPYQGVEFPYRHFPYKSVLVEVHQSTDIPKPFLHPIFSYKMTVWDFINS